MVNYDERRHLKHRSLIRVGKQGMSTMNLFHSLNGIRLRVDRNVNKPAQCHISLLAFSSFFVNLSTETSLFTTEREKDETFGF